MQITSSRRQNERLRKQTLIEARAVKRQTALKSEYIH